MGAVQRREHPGQIGNGSLVQENQLTVRIDTLVVEITEIRGARYSRAVTFESTLRSAVSRIGGRRRGVDTEGGTVASEDRIDRGPIECRIADGLVSIRIANAGFQRIQPAALADVVFCIHGERRFPAAVVLFMTLNEGD